MSETLTQVAAAKVLGVDRATVGRMLRDGRLAGVPVTTRTGLTVTRIPAEQIEKLKANAAT